MRFAAASIILLSIAVILIITIIVIYNSIPVVPTNVQIIEDFVEEFPEDKDVDEDTNLPIEIIERVRVTKASSEISRDPIPLLIHQIWVGSRPPPQSQIDVWVKLSEDYGYTHRLWLEEDIHAFGLENQKYFDKMMTMKFYQGASDVARYEILNAYGGIYCDADIIPEDLPIFDYLPNNGFGVSVEHQPIPISIGSGAIFTANGFMMSCPNHPILDRVIESLPGNYDSFEEVNFIEAFLATGPYLLTACLFGIYTIIDKNWIMNDAHDDQFRLVRFV
jgi:mannosyltransferase OCH1-like enzyme